MDNSMEHYISLFESKEILNEDLIDMILNFDKKDPEENNILNLILEKLEDYYVSDILLEDNSYHYKEGIYEGIRIAKNIIKSEMNKAKNNG